MAKEYIERDALMDFANNHVGNSIDTNDIARFPAADVVEVKHAQWIGVQNGRGCCSNCHRQDGIDPIATHCRYCGAKMDGKENNNAQTD